MGSEIILQHEPFANGDSLENYLSLWKEKNMLGTLILNPKEDGLEAKTIELLEKYSIIDYFFLDLTIPTLVRLCLRNEHTKIAHRVSEYEPAATAELFVKHLDWIWLDSFSGKAAPQTLVESLRKNFQICAVSPELQGFSTSLIPAFKSSLKGIHAVCTKNPELWGWKA